MDYEKILESLKICSEVGTSCEGCSGRGERHCIANLTKAAAIAIETLLHALDMAQRERDVVTKRMVELEQEVCRLKSRLAAYEDTGLEPEEISDAVTAAKLMARSKIVSCFGVDADHVRDLVKAEQDGRLVVLPCKVGDTVYTVQQVGRGHWEEDKYILDDRGTPKVYEKKFSLILLEYIGKTVFLTREEAEAALAQEGGTNEDSGGL